MNSFENFQISDSWISLRHIYVIIVFFTLVCQGCLPVSPLNSYNVNPFGREFIEVIGFGHPPLWTRVSIKSLKTLFINNQTCFDSLRPSSGNSSFISSLSCCYWILKMFKIFIKTTLLSYGSICFVCLWCVLCGGVRCWLQQTIAINNVWSLHPSSKLNLTL